MNPLSVLLMLLVIDVPCHLGCLINRVAAHVSTSNEDGGIREQTVHFLEGQLPSLWQHGPEEDGIRQVCHL